MPNHSLSSLMGLTSNPMTGKVICLRVCANCEQAGNQSSFIQSYAAVMGCPISHGICVPHYQAQMASLLGEQQEMTIGA